MPDFSREFSLLLFQQMWDEYPGFQSTNFRCFSSKTMKNVFWKLSLISGSYPGFHSNKYETNITDGGFHSTNIRCFSSKAKEIMFWKLSWISGSYHGFQSMNFLCFSSNKCETHIPDFSRRIFTALLPRRWIMCSGSFPGFQSTNFHCFSSNKCETNFSIFFWKTCSESFPANSLTLLLSILFSVTMFTKADDNRILHFGVILTISSKWMNPDVVGLAFHQVERKVLMLYDGLVFFVIPTRPHFENI